MSEVVENTANEEGENTPHMTTVERAEMLLAQDGAIRAKINDGATLDEAVDPSNKEFGPLAHPEQVQMRVAKRAMMLKEGIQPYPVTLDVTATIEEVRAKYDGKLEAGVFPTLVNHTYLLARVGGAYNAVRVEGNAVGSLFLHGLGAGSLPTASSILSDIMARLHDYRYEYKKMNYVQKPGYTTDITLKIYARYKETDVQGILNFSKIHEQFISEESNYVIGDILLSELMDKRSQLSGRDVFLANIPIFFLNRDR